MLVKSPRIFKRDEGSISEINQQYIVQIAHKKVSVVLETKCYKI